MLTTLLEALLATQYRRDVSDGPERLSPSYILQQSRILESATKCYLAAVRELARVRKLLAGVPAATGSSRRGPLGGVPEVGSLGRAE